MRQNMSFQVNAYNSDNSFDIEPPPRRATVSQARSSANAFNSRQKVNQMQLEAYLQKLKEYRIKLNSLQEELAKCRQENESLIFDLRDSKTKVAILEEQKAQLEMELAREKEKTLSAVNRASKQYIEQVRKHADQKQNFNYSPKTPHTPQPLTIAARSSGSAGIGGGMFGKGGKIEHAIKVEPAFSHTKSNKLNSSSTTHNSTKPTNVLAQSRQSSDSQPAQALNTSGARSPRAAKMIPLSQKFCAFPATEMKSKSASFGLDDNK